ncbi:MAG: ATP-binding cassette domain-containing protein, partial [Alicyclobacillus herbarius]|uniref:ATP-binding cassette domain-containing protein n=1 Tax=Alicyclobacillus herbarius TaxID=122960 RepID=UPI002353BDAF
GDDCLVSLQGVSLTYPGADAPVLSDVDFHLNRGESVLFLGPSGSGKSTLALLVAGLVPGAVEAEVRGNVWRHPQLAEPGRVGMVFQDPETQLCMLEVGDEVAFGLENLSIPPAEMPGRVRKALRERGLDVPLAAPHLNFSGGMKQKLAMACAWVMEPQLLICDEPTANLDPLASRQVFQELARLHEHGQTLLIIEHRFDPLLPFMDKVVLMDASGRIHRSGPTLEVVSAEWGWMQEVGIVPVWKSPPWKEAPVSGIRPHTQGRTRAQEWTGTEERAGAPEPTRMHERTDEAHGNMAVTISSGRLAYDGRTVWDGLNVSIPEGSFTAIVGPNGSGKSSLLQAMLGMVKLTQGEVAVFGRRLRDWPRRKLLEEAAFCFQNPEYQFIFERVADELANRVVGEEIPDEVHGLLREFGLAGTERKSPFSLSQGQKRRLSVATMLRQPHRLYLLDEPTFGQDALTQAALMTRLAELHQSGATIVLTTHDLDLVRQWATQVIVLAEGGLLFSGRPEELFARPDLMQKAHLVDDLLPLQAEELGQGNAAVEATRSDAVRVQSTTEYSVRPKPMAEVLAGQSLTAAASPPLENELDAPVRSHARRRTALAARINPAVQLLSLVVAVCLVMAIRSIPQGIGVFALVVALMMGLAGLRPTQVVKRMSPFLVFYILYVWTQAAYAQAPPGTPTLDILWYHLSWPGFLDGVVLALRMLSAVGLGVYVLSSVDITETFSAFCQNLRVPPKFSYGMLAGMRYLPLFQAEWTRLRQARQLRGREAKLAVVRPAVYALPLLSQAVRMAERSALAMEARGFHGEAARTAQGRTYYRQVSLRWWDVAYGMGLNAAILALIWVLQG